VHPICWWFTKQPVFQSPYTRPQALRPTISLLCMVKKSPAKGMITISITSSTRYNCTLFQSTVHWSVDVQTWNEYSIIVWHQFKCLSLKRTFVKREEEGGGKCTVVHYSWGSLLLRSPSLVWPVPPPPTNPPPSTPLVSPGGWCQWGLHEENMARIP
jgi:hypothetical protein